MEKAKVLLVFSDTGAGHRSAAEALRRAIHEICEERNELVPDIILEDLVEESNSINRLFAKVYNGLLKNKQEWMKYYITLIELVKPNENAIAYKLAASYMKKKLSSIEPTIVVSVHPMVNHFLARAMKELGMSRRVKLLTVLTDPNANLWTGWACPDADLTIAPNDITFNKLVSLGLSPEKIQVIGMPIQPAFIKEPVVSKRDFLREYRLNPDLPTVVVSAGSAGGGNMLKIYKSLAECKREFQVLFICGKNMKLKQKMDQEKLKSPFKTVVLKYVSSMPEVMTACDLLVTKAGGLTTFEAIARRMPMAIDLVTKPMPQESGTATMLIETGLAQGIRKPSDIVHIVENLELVSDRLSKPLPSDHNLDRVDAVYSIADTILQLCRNSDSIS